MTSPDPPRSSWLLTFLGGNALILGLVYGGATYVDDLAQHQGLALSAGLQLAAVVLASSEQAAQHHRSPWPFRLYLAACLAVIAFTGKRLLLLWPR